MPARQPLAGPSHGLAPLGWDPGVRQSAVEQADLLPVRVAVQRHHPLSQAEEEVERLGGHGSGGDVPAQDDEVRSRRLDVREHGFEGGHVSVDVVEDRDLHRGPHPRAGSLSVKIAGAAARRRTSSSNTSGRE